MIGGRQSSDQRSFMVYVENNDGKCERKINHLSVLLLKST